jgi:hypothetical protein
LQCTTKSNQKLISNEKMHKMKFRTMCFVYLFALLNNERNGPLTEAAVVMVGVCEPAARLLEAASDGVRWLRHAAPLDAHHGARHQPLQLGQLLLDAVAECLSLGRCALAGSAQLAQRVRHCRHVSAKLAHLSCVRWQGTLRNLLSVPQDLTHRLLTHASLQCQWILKMKNGFQLVFILLKHFNSLIIKLELQVKAQIFPYLLKNFLSILLGGCYKNLQVQTLKFDPRCNPKTNCFPEKIITLI